MCKQTYKIIGIAVLTSLAMLLFVTECIHVNELMWMPCGQSPLPSRTLYRVTLDECADECVKRPYCDVLRYWRSKTMCQIVKYDEDQGTCYRRQKGIDDQEKCLEIQRCDINAPQCNCSEPQICEDGDCVIKECPIWRHDNAQVMGNMQEIGSKIKVTCILSFGSENPPKIAVCNNTGGWSNLPDCDYPEGVRKVGNWVFSVRQEYVKQTTAAESCRNTSGFLVKIDTQEKQDAITYLLSDDTVRPFGYWIQGTFQSGDWKFDDGMTIPRDFWRAGQPDYSSLQSCIRLMKDENYSKWDNYWCYTKNVMHFVCEYTFP